jgi:hypothetical protein
VKEEERKKLQEQTLCKLNCLHLNIFDLLSKNVEVKLGKIITKYETFLFSKFQKKWIFFVRNIIMRNSLLCNQEINE